MLKIISWIFDKAIKFYNYLNENGKDKKTEANQMNKVKVLRPKDFTSIKIENLDHATSKDERLDFQVINYEVKF